MIVKKNILERIKIFGAGLATGLTFYIPYITPLVFLFLLTLYERERNFSHFIVFGLGFFTAALFPLIKAIALITLSLPLTLLIFSLAVAFLSLLQFGGTYLLNKLIRFLPLSYTAVELAREKFLFDGSPYFLIGHIWGYLPFFNLSYCCIPPEGFTFLIFLLAFLLYKLKQTNRWSYAFILYGIVSLIAAISFSKISVSIYIPNLNLTVVQPFFKQIDKLENPRLLIPFLEFLIVQTPKEGLIALPETVLDYRTNIKKFAATFPDRDFLMGVQRISYNSEKKKIEALNEVLLIEKGQIVNRYIKRYLVPFGEYTPVGFRFFGRIIPYLARIDYTSGENFKTFNYHGVKITPLICNEIFFLPNLQKGDLIAILSNDAWFFSPFINYHRLLAKIEAIKTDRVVLFVNNNGGSGIFLPNGGEYNCGNRKICFISLTYSQ